MHNGVLEGKARPIVPLAGLLLIALALVVNISTTHAQTDLQVLDSRVEYTFGEALTFQAQVDLPAATDELWLFFSPEGRYQTQTHRVTANSRGEVTFVLDLQQEPLPPFATIHFWLQATTSDGRELTSASASFVYQDNRFDWRTRRASPFRVHWYQGDLSFAQEVIDTARFAQEQIASLLSLDVVHPEDPQAPDWIDIYVYARAADMQSALAYEGPTWVAGHADPEFSVMLVSLPEGPAQVLEMERQVPHELAHILLYRKTGPGYYTLPMWLNEGLASVSELYPNPDYDLLLEDAFARDTMLPVTSLCHRFPSSASEALLAYAESTSLVRYLSQQYGRSSIDRLLSAYTDGQTCEIGAQTALGKPLSQIEREWRQASFGENALLAAFRKMLPFLSLLALMTLPLLVSALLRSRGGAQEQSTEEQWVGKTSP